MTDALNNFPITSRYYGVPIASLEDDSGETVFYLCRRTLPQPETLTLVEEHIVALGDRLDNVTSHYLDDPEQFWRVADANRALRAEEVVDCVGRRLRITLPPGIPGGFRG